MTLIEWKDEFNLGIEEVDSEHRILVELINALHEAMLAGAGRSDVVEGISQIYAIVSGHFEHKEDHEVLLDDLREILEQVRSGGGYAEDRLSADLQYWFSDHFRTHDARLHQRAETEERPAW